ncbi:MAG: hypothetical protein SNJ82_11770 [Gemmataceae bacterium]
MDRNLFSAPVQTVLARLPVMGLRIGQPHRAARAMIEVACAELPLPCQAGLWLAFDFFEESHAISQALHTPEGSAWHAILHRREPDAFNSKYWWRRVGSHPVLEQLRQQTPALGYCYTTPEAFVEWCERVRESGSSDEQLAQEVQRREWELFFAWSARQNQ